MGFFRDISTCCVVKLGLIVNSHKEPQERALCTEECRNYPFQHDLRNLLERERGSIERQRESQ